MDAKRALRFFTSLILVAFAISACFPACATTAPAIPQDTAMPGTESPRDTLVPLETSAPATFPLAEPGPYHAGNQEYALVDESRQGRQVDLLIWYPALEQVDADGRLIVRDAVPDTSGSPYPVILTEPDSGRTIFLSHLASHGFIMVVVKSPKSIQGEPLGEFPLIDSARDFLFALDQLASHPPEGLAAIMDSDHAGVTGYSYGGDISLTVSGARIDPDFYRSQCQHLTEIVPESIQWVYLEWYCTDAANWDEFVTYVGEATTHTEEGLWQPMTDERIRAVMPMAPTVSWYFGERGLAAIDRPTLLIWGTRDDLSSYQLEAPYTFENVGTPEKFLISFIGRTHFLVQLEEATAWIKHFATAFFGYYLQGRQDYRQYLSEDFVSQFGELAWGVYAGE